MDADIMTAVLAKPVHELMEIETRGAGRGEAGREDAEPGRQAAPSGGRERSER